MEDFVFDEAAYPARPPKLPVVEQEKPNNWFDLFHDMENKYDWNDRHWQRLNSRRVCGFMRIPLTQGYSMIVLIRDYERMTIYPDGSPKIWHANVQYDKWGNITAIYGVRRGREQYGEPRAVLAHREALNCFDDPRVADHVNGYGLDNRADTDRDVNLILCSQRMNIHNARSNRRVHIDLPRGVEMKGTNENGEQLYGWMRSYRLNREELAARIEAANGKSVSRVDYIRSLEVWTSADKAHEEYEKEIERITGGKKSGVHTPRKVNFPIFPPPMDSEPAQPRRSKKSKEWENEIPF